MEETKLTEEELEEINRLMSENYQYQEETEQLSMGGEYQDQE